MSSGKDREQQAELNLDQVLGGLFKGFGAALDVLAETLDAGAANLIRLPERERLERQYRADMREPPVDIFDEGREIRLVTELPGAHAGDIRVAAQDDILDLETVGEPRYARELLLPSLVDPSTLEWTYRNGILEVRLEKLDGDDPA